EITSVDVFLADVPIGTPIIKIWNYGVLIPPGAGDLIYEQEFTPVIADWTTVDLTIPVYITGGDIWVGYEYEFIGETYVAGCDDGPLDPNGDWMSTGPGWNNLSGNPLLPYNWNIRALLTGDPITQWLSVSPASGTVLPGESADIDVEFDATDLEPGTAYSGAIIVNSNDLTNQQFEVDVTLDVLYGINEYGKIAVMMYPNPVINTLNIKADDNIISVELLNLMGQQITFNNVNELTHQIDLSNLQTGVYVVKVKMETGVVTKKITVE
ncbi:MAG: T9SS type A sorting domain-containing protein, partial [Bacteroidales bacterium]|nr:T9SS type A sorting domain-containing protein [Bacteroidales bacterium]